MNTEHQIELDCGGETDWCGNVWVAEPEHIVCNFCGSVLKPTGKERDQIVLPPDFVFDFGDES